jgi:hypothetical protein
LVSGTRFRECRTQDDPRRVKAATGGGLQWWLPLKFPHLVLELNASFFLAQTFGHTGQLEGKTFPCKPKNNRKRLQVQVCMHAHACGGGNSYSGKTDWLHLKCASEWSRLVKSIYCCHTLSRIFCLFMVSIQSDAVAAPSAGCPKLDVK